MVTPVPARASTRADTRADTRASTRVLIADDHPVVADGLAEAVGALEGFEVVAVASNGIEALAAIRGQRPDLALIDHAMPGATGLEVFVEGRRWSPETRFVVITAQPGATLLEELIGLGVDGLLRKSTPVEAMLDAVRAVAGGERVIDEAVTAIVARAEERTALTPREHEVLRAIARGQTNADAGELLGLSPKTVDRHRTALMRKLGVHSTARLVLVAVREGLIDPDESA